MSYLIGWLVIVFNITAWYLLIYYQSNKAYSRSLILIVLSVRFYKQKLNTRSMALGFSECLKDPKMLEDGKSSVLNSRQNNPLWLV